jgi:polysaccharide biosynthesis protein PslH
MARKRVFVIASRVPYPLDKGDKLRIYHQIKELAKEFDVCLLVLSDKGLDARAQSELEQVVSKVIIIQLKRWLIPFQLLRALLSEKPFQVWYFYQKWAHRRVVAEIEQYQPDFIYCQLIRAAEYVKSIHHIPKSLDYMDAFSKGIERRIAGAGWQKFVFRMEYKRLIKYENLIYDYFEHHMIISLQDRNWILHPTRDKIDIVPNGVDHSYFQPLRTEKQFDLVFVGNMNYPPNVDAAVFLVNEIAPLLSSQRLDCTVVIGGASPSSDVLSLQSDKVKITGWIEDIRTVYDSASVFVAPLRIGTGLQNKLLEAMAMGLPCVTSSLAAQALVGGGEGNVNVANSAEEYARVIIELLEQKELQMVQGENARNYVIKNYSWKSNTQPLIQAIERLTT